MRRRIVWVLIVLLAAVALLSVSRRLVLTTIGSVLVVRDEPQPADAIVMLAGSLPDRILEAVDLYQAHLAPRILLTREFPLPGMEALRARGGHLLDHYEENLGIAHQLGVPAAALSVMPTPTASTLAEARAVVAYLRSEGIHSILLVTSKTHARRARMIFRAVAGPELHVAIIPSIYDPFTVEDWWKNRAFSRRVVIEYGKLLMFLFVDRWRAPLARADGQ